MLFKLFNSVKMGCGGLFFLTVVAWAQFDSEFILSPGVLTAPYGGGAYQKSDRVIDELQSAMIYNMFTKPMFETNDIIKGDDEDEDNWLTNKQSEKLMNELLARALAEELARQDMLKLKRQLRRQLDI